MLYFLKKAETWEYLDNKKHSELGWKNAQIHLKTWQDTAIYARISDLSGKSIAEIGGGNSRILPQLSDKNDCTNIDKLEGQHGGPTGDQGLKNVRTVRAFVGEQHADLSDESFDVIFSVSVVEHVPMNNCDAFLTDLLRMLKPGGVSYHAIDLYVGTDPVPGPARRLEVYKEWLERSDLEPLGDIEAVEALFTSDMATNPDLTMWHWNRVAPALKDLRKEAQSVSLILGFRKKA